jgi:outer membrane protein assembly factor BamA
LKNPIVYQSLKYRLGESDIFLGAGYLYTSSEIKLNREEDAPLIDRQAPKMTSSALGLIIDYDTRDNALSPNKGMLFNARANFFTESLGSDNDFQKYFLQELLYMPLSEKINLDHRVSFDKVVGDEAPFYMYPSVNMRGVPAMRYQGENVALYEAQFTYGVTARWSAVAFAGVARAYGKSSSLKRSAKVSFQDAPTVVSKGVGFRYMIAEKFGLRMGVDIAMSNEDKAFYIQFGTAWIGL